jgi:cation transport ATPase
MHSGVEGLKKMGIHPVMLTGENWRIAKKFVSKSFIDSISLPLTIVFFLEHAHICHYVGRH